MANIQSHQRQMPSVSTPKQRQQQQRQQQQQQQKYAYKRLAVHVQAAACVHARAPVVQLVRRTSRQDVEFYSTRTAYVPIVGCSKSCRWGGGQKLQRLATVARPSRVTAAHALRRFVARASMRAAAAAAFPVVAAVCIRAAFGHGRPRHQPSGRNSSTGTRRCRCRCSRTTAAITITARRVVRKPTVWIHNGNTRPRWHDVREGLAEHPPGDRRDLGIPVRQTAGLARLQGSCRPQGFDGMRVSVWVEEEGEEEEEEGRGRGRKKKEGERRERKIINCGGWGEGQVTELLHAVEEMPASPCIINSRRRGRPSSQLLWVHFGLCWNIRRAWKQRDTWWCDRTGGRAHAKRCHKQRKQRHQLNPNG